MMTATVFITGTNRGLGLEFIRQYAEQGDNAIACYLNLAKVTELSQLAALHANIQLHVMDKNQIAKLTQVFKNKAIDVLIHNACVGEQCEKSGDCKSTNQIFWLVLCIRWNTVAVVSVVTKNIWPQLCNL
jgi:NAD(P)-dependent dehydrogenase (short-subunit alcohol dehydrogenase family)